MADSFTTLLEGGSYFEAPRWHDGRWWVSDFYRPEVRTVSPDGDAERVAQVDGQPAGLGWLAPTPPYGPAEQVVDALQLAPDGCTLDADGHIWAADALGGRAVRVAPGGDNVDEVRPPSGYGVFACMLGGLDGTTLLLCTASDFLEHNRAPTRETVLVVTDVDVPHAGSP